MTLADDPQWYRDAVIYELHVRSFADSDNDGIGDFAGLTSKLDYLSDLGVTALWILPFYPSPLRDDGYDIADYTGVNPSYGTLRDFRKFLKAAHDRGLRVITELVMNHTSDQHEWFQRARRAPKGSKWRDYYVWEDTPDRWSEARIIFQDYETSNWSWDPVAGQYYWHRFYHHQPDLNFENPDVRKAMFDTLDRWFEMGVDGVRLDAVPYLFERDGTNCENLPETHEFLKELRTHVDSKWDNRMFLAEANQWPEDAAAYFGEGDECHMNFHFPVMPRLFMAVRQEERLPIVDILEQTPPLPPGCQWATFLRNHDELTLEMVTDEERDYMVRAYAHDPQMRVNLGIRRRLAPLLQNDRRRIELLNGLLFSLPGTPVVYYGDEIGMGDNVYLGDRDSVRTPMQWSPDRNAGFSRANPQQLFLPPVIDPEYHYETINVEHQLHNPNSLLWWTRRLISLRKRHRVFGRGDLEFIEADNPKVLAFTRTLEEDGSTDQLLVVANLSRHSQPVELDLRHLQGLAPVEMFGHTRFAPIGELPYYLNLAPYQFFWFALEPVVSADGPLGADWEPPAVAVDKDWHELFSTPRPTRLAEVIPSYLQQRRWFAGKDRTVREVRIGDVVPIGGTKRKPLGYLVITEVRYVGADPETYLLVFAAATGDRAADLLTYHPESVVARVDRGGSDQGLLVDGLVDSDLCRALLDTIVRKKELPGRSAEAVGRARPDLRGVANGIDLEPKLLGVEQSNTSVVFGDRILLKLIRRIEEGTNPELEVGEALTEVGFQNIAPVLGALEHGDRRRRTTLAVAQEYVHHESDAWTLTLDLLGRFYEQVVTDGGTLRSLAAAPDPLKVAEVEIPDEVSDLLGAMIEPVEDLARRTGEMHLALASVPGEDFAAEAFSTLYQRSLYQSFRGQTRTTMAAARRKLRDRRSPLAPEAADELARLVDGESALIELFGEVRAHRIDTRRARVHGDYHLGQVLWTGRDMIIIDFEGEPARSIGERRIKKSPLVDVAGMVRSFHYATSVALFEQTERGILPDVPDAVREVEAWGDWWRRWVEAHFLRTYLDVVDGSGLVPADTSDLALLLDAYALEKALYELRYELQYRPDWVPIPLGAILSTLEREPSR